MARMKKIRGKNFSDIFRVSMTKTLNILDKPIIYLLRCHHCIEAQTWATWALASLTHKEESNGKYIQLTIEEGGFVALEELVSRNKASPFIIQKVGTFHMTLS